MQLPDLTGKTMIVTGGNSGIGWETAAALAEAGARVVITARNPEKGKAAVARIEERSPKGSVELSVFDLSDLGSVQDGANDLLDRFERIDVLINNAGLMMSERKKSVDGVEMTFATNHLGPFLLTRLLLDRIKGSAPARIVNVSSTAHHTARSLDLEELRNPSSYRAMDVYGRSKLCNILFTTELARRLEGTGVTVNCLHPGTVRTGFAGDGDATGLFALGVRIAGPFMLTAAKGAATTIYLATSPEVDGVTGRYFVKSKERVPSKAARDVGAARRLWDESERLTGLASA